MSNHKSRLAKLERHRAPRGVIVHISEADHNRSMEALAAALGMITGATVTAPEAEQAIKELSYEQLR